VERRASTTHLEDDDAFERLIFGNCEGWGPTGKKYQRSKRKSCGSTSSTIDRHRQGSLMIIPLIDGILQRHLTSLRCRVQTIPRHLQAQRNHYLRTDEKICLYSWDSIEASNEVADQKRRLLSCHRQNKGSAGYPNNNPEHLSPTRPLSSRYRFKG
jgi:hypothetical protein